MLLFRATANDDRAEVQEPSHEMPTPTVMFSVPSEIFELDGAGVVPGNFKFKCKLCSVGGLKTISANAKSRVNLRNHVKTKHAGHLKKFDDWCTLHDHRRGSKRPHASTSHDVLGTSSTSKPATITEFFHQGQVKKLTQSKLDEIILHYIAESVLPFNHVESDAFQKFVSSLLGTTFKQLKIKSRVTYKHQMKALFESRKAELLLSLKSVKKLCITVDHWSSRRKGYIGITAHWYEASADGMNRRQACIALRRVTGRCTYDVLARIMESVIVEFDITGKVTHCITDSGSNFLKAFKVFGDQSQVGNASDNVDRDEDDVMEPAEINDILENGPAEDCPEMFNLPRHMRCAAHRMNLVATGSRVETALNNPRCKSVHRSLMGKLSAVWNKQSRSTASSDNIKESLGILFITPNTTRWNSTYDALSRVQRLFKEKKAELQAVFTTEGLRPITDGEETFLNEFLKVMKPLADALDVIQGEDNVCAGYMLPTIQMLLKMWKEIEQKDDLQLCGGLLCVMNADITRRFDDELHSDYFKVAAALHPKFKLRWISDTEKRVEVRELVKNALELIQVGTPLHTNPMPTATTQPRESFFSGFEDDMEVGPASVLYDKWSVWAESRESSIPEALKPAYMEYNTTIPSSAPVERLFSLSKRVLTPTRSLLGDETFEQCVLIPALKKSGL